ncbi:MAG: MBL fold metallo-hydrolase [Flavobacteriaceae bacterium]
MKSVFKNISQYLGLRLVFKTVLLVLFFLVSCNKSEDYAELLEVQTFPERTNDFSLWQLAPFFDEVQMSYILKTDDGNIIVVDGGGIKSAPVLESYLIQLGGQVDTWILTHPHLDHIGAIMEIIKSDKVSIDRILHVPLEESWVGQYEPQTRELVAAYNQLLKTKAINTVSVNPGEVFELGAGVEMKALSGLNESIISNAVNNSSLVFSIRSLSKSVLFLGDLGSLGGKTLLEKTDPAQLKTTYVQMAHHGQAGVDREIYEAVKAEYALWPTPKWLWENRADGKAYNSGNFKTFVVREWMEELGIKKNYVSGLDSTVQID